MMLVTSLNAITHFFETENYFSLVQPVAWQTKHKSIVALLGMQFTSSFHFFTSCASFGMQLLVQSQRQQTTHCEVKSTLCTVWVILTFCKSTWCKFSDHFSPSFPHMRVSLVPEKQKLKFYCLSTVFSFNCSNESANLKTSVKNTEEFLKEPPSWSGIYRYIFH
jgi:hypothetical protein